MTAPSPRAVSMSPIVEHTTARSHTPKLRASCDACAVSKVKCTKERPVCSRCAKRGATCKYLATKRQQGEHNAATSKSPRPTMVQREPAWLSNVSLPNTPLSVDDMVTSDAFNSATMSNPTYSNIDLDDFLTNSLNDSLSSYDELQGLLAQTTGHDANDLLSDSNNDTIFLFTSNNSFPMVDDIMADLSAHSQPSTSPTTHTTSLFGERLLEPSPSDPSCCCLINALGFLKRLSPGSAAVCIRSAARGTEDDTSRLLTIESVVKQNGEIIESIHSMLQCPCSHDGYILTTISLVVLKIIEWYAAIAQVSSTLSTYGGESEAGIANGVRQIQSALTSTHSDRILPFPATVGDYRIDGGKDSHRMAAQLVLSELHRVQGLVNLFSRRLKHDGEGIAGSPFNAGPSAAGGTTPFEIGMATDSPVTPGILAQLHDNLGRRLRVVWQKTVDVLQRG